MKPRRFAKHLLAACLLSLLLYSASYHFIEKWRVRRQPWTVSFEAREGVPAVRIEQPGGAATNVLITFHGEQVPSNFAPRALTFSQPRAFPFEVPFGRCIFLDTTFLPGSVAFELCGHEIELLPRALIIDRNEHPWVGSTNIALVTGVSDAQKR